jgi:hypothetical protein
LSAMRVSPSGFPPKMMSVPRPAMLVAIVTEHGNPACATTYNNTRVHTTQQSLSAACAQHQHQRTTGYLGPWHHKQCSPEATADVSSELHGCCTARVLTCASNLTFSGFAFSSCTRAASGLKAGLHQSCSTLSTSSLSLTVLVPISTGRPDAQHDSTADTMYASLSCKNSSHHGTGQQTRGCSFLKAAAVHSGPADCCCMSGY